jgi:putative nucleotidyltransferase with HDIG domain
VVRSERGRPINPLPFPLPFGGTATTRWWERLLRLPAALALSGVALVASPQVSAWPWRPEMRGLLAAALLWLAVWALRDDWGITRWVWPGLALALGAAKLTGVLTGIVPAIALLPLLATVPVYPLESLALLAVASAALLVRGAPVAAMLPWEVTAWSIIVAAALLRLLARGRRQADTLLSDCVRVVSSPDDAESLHLLQQFTATGEVGLLRGEPEQLGVSAVERPFIWLQGDRLREGKALVAQGMVQLPAAFPRGHTSAIDLQAAPGSKLYVVGEPKDDDALLRDIAGLIGLRESHRLLTARLRSADYGALESLVQALDARDPYTRGHSERVARYAVAIGEALGLSADLIDALQRGGMLHDIGKIGIPEHILHKPERLTAEEYAVMQRHVKIGIQIIDAINSSTSVLDIVSSHHEHHNGSGYPRQLQGEQIPLLARIAHVADSYEAMTSARSYNRPRPLSEGIAELRRCAGSQFHPEIVEVFARVLQPSNGRSVPAVV